MSAQAKTFFSITIACLVALLFMPVQPVAAAETIVHSEFNLAFTPGHKFEDSKGDTYEVEVLDAGNIDIVSGRVCVFDSYTLWDDAHPFLKKVKPGKYPLKISRATIRAKGYEDKPNTLGHKDVRNACAKLVLRKGKAVRWELAKSWDPERKAVIKFVGVDAGCASIIDYRTLMQSRSQEDRIIDYVPKKYTPFYTMDLNKAKGTKLVRFDTGYGDGAYPSFWGYDKAGNRVELVSDFGILIEDIPKTVVIDDVVKYRGKVIDHPELKKHNLKLKVLKAWPNQLKAAHVKRLLAIRAKLFILLEPMSGAQLTLINGRQKSYSGTYHTPGLKNSGIEYFRVRGPIRPDAKLVIEFHSETRQLN